MRKIAKKSGAASKRAIIYVKEIRRSREMRQLAAKVTRIPNDTSRSEQERLRRRFRPAHLHLLFIGESPPASGRFFYRGDSGLYRALLATFRSVDPLISDNNFLDLFRAAGCYLIDLCHEPVDQLDPKSRSAVCRASEETLSTTIALLQPAAIATVVRSIESNVVRALAGTEWRGRCIHLPYPGRWSRLKHEFIQSLGPTVAELLRHRRATIDDCNVTRYLTVRAKGCCCRSEASGPRDRSADG